MAKETHRGPWMPFLRSIALFAVLLAALAIGAPLQLLLARARPAAAALVPHLLCRTLLALLGVKLVCRDPPKSTSARLVVANHVSWLDVLVLARLEPLCFLAKSEVAGWPFFGPLAKVNSTVFVNRSRRRSIPARTARWRHGSCQAAACSRFPRARLTLDSSAAAS